MDETAAELCAETLRRFDRGRYLATLFAPKEKRPGLWAVYAFASEIARAHEMREEIAREIRLQWWRDRIAAIYAGAPQEAPTACALADAVAAHGLARDRLEAVIEAAPADAAARVRELALDVLGATNGRSAFPALVEPRGGRITMPLRLLWAALRRRLL
jgi:phytoene/squalene synthetase